MLNIFEATPVIKPSLFVSIASEVTALANPDIVTKAPPPPNFAILSKNPIPVEIAVKRMTVNEVNRREVLSAIPKYKYSVLIVSPIKQIVPPTKNAFAQFFIQGERSARLLVYS